MLENKKHRPTSVFKMPAMTADVAKEQARINTEKAKGMTILEAYDCKFGSGSYQRPQTHPTQANKKQTHPTQNTHHQTHPTQTTHHQTHPTQNPIFKTESEKNAKTGTKTIPVN